MISMEFNLLAWLSRKGIDDPAKLTGEEKATYENYQQILSKKELTIEDLRVFLKQERAKIEAKWRTYEPGVKDHLIPHYTVYGVILEALDAPETARKQLEEFLIKQTL